MAYQNVGTPVFYVDYLLWRKSLGLYTVFSLVPPEGGTLSFDQTTLEKTLNLNPSNQITLYSPDDAAGGYVELIAPPLKPSSTSTSTRYFAILGHNFNSSGHGVSLSGTADISFDNLVNGVAEYDGFSIIKNITGLIYEDGSQSAAPDGVYRIGLSATTNPLKVGCYSVGNYYQMPHSPDLSLTMTREYGGVKTIETKGGASLSNDFGSSPQKWGNRAAWQLGDQDFSVGGRRTWSLSFSYLSDSSVFPDNPTEIDGGGWEDLTTTPDFMSEVLKKTNGGQLPFIFQPDKDNNDPFSGFAIAKLDMSSFKFDQVANGVYNVKLKIREVW